jgi:hypothetical protein
MGFRLASEHIAPPAKNKCHIGLSWIAANARQCGIDPDCLMVIGQSSNDKMVPVWHSYVEIENGQSSLGNS